MLSRQPERREAWTAPASGAFHGSEMETQALVLHYYRQKAAKEEAAIVAALAQFVEQLLLAGKPRKTPTSAMVPTSRSRCARSPIVRLSFCIFRIPATDGSRSIESK